jgi:hypothetical protein
MKSTWRFILGASAFGTAAALALAAQAGPAPGRSVGVHGPVTATRAGPAAVRPGASVSVRPVGRGRDRATWDRATWDRAGWGRGREAWRHEHGRGWRRDRAWGGYDLAGYGYGYGFGPAGPASGAGLLDGRLLEASPELELPTKFDLPRVAGYHSADVGTPVAFVLDEGPYGAPASGWAPRASVAPSARVITVGVDHGFASGRPGPRIISVPAR